MLRTKVAMKNQPKIRPVPRVSILPRPVSTLAPWSRRSNPKVLCGDTLLGDVAPPGDGPVLSDSLPASAQPALAPPAAAAADAALLPDGLGVARRQRRSTKLAASQCLGNARARCPLPPVGGVRWSHIATCRQAVVTRRSISASDVSRTKLR